MRFNASSILRINLRSPSRVRSSRLNSSSCVARSFGSGKLAASSFMCSTVRSTSTMRSRFQFCRMRVKCSSCSLLMYCSPRRAMYGLTLRGPARRLADPDGSLSPSSSGGGGVRVGITSGRESNLTVGAAFSTAVTAGPLAAADAGFAGAAAWDLRRAGLLGASRLASCFASCLASCFVSCLVSCLTRVDFGGGLCAFTVTFVVWPGDARVAFLATTAVLRTAAFFGTAVPGFFAALLAFFEGIRCLRLQRESARLYRRNTLCTEQRGYCFLTVQYIDKY